MALIRWPVISCEGQTEGTLSEALCIRRAYSRNTKLVIFRSKLRRRGKSLISVKIMTSTTILQIFNGGEKEKSRGFGLKFESLTAQGAWTNGEVRNQDFLPQQR